VFTNKHHHQEALIMATQPSQTMASDEAANAMMKIGTNDPEKPYAGSEENQVELQRTVSSMAPNYPSTAKLAVIMASLYISIFLIALDRTIIGVAVPKITDQFHSTSDIGWYGSVCYCLLRAHWNQADCFCRLTC
jgi:hypothetical protein